MNAREKLQQQKEERINQLAEQEEERQRQLKDEEADRLNDIVQQLVDKLMVEAQASPESSYAAIAGAVFQGREFYAAPCELPVVRVPCQLSYCWRCTDEKNHGCAFSQQRSKDELHSDRVVFRTIRKICGLNYVTCEEEECCNAGSDACVINHGIRSFDPVHLRGLAKVLYEKLTSEEFDFKVEPEIVTSTSFRFCVRW